MPSLRAVARAVARLLRNRRGGGTAVVPCRIPGLVIKQLERLADVSWMVGSARLPSARSPRAAPAGRAPSSSSRARTRSAGCRSRASSAGSPRIRTSASCSSTTAAPTARASCCASLEKRCRPSACSVLGARPRTAARPRRCDAASSRRSAATPSCVGYWDADLATPLDGDPRVPARARDASASVEIVIGARVRLLGRKIERSALRHYLGRARRRPDRARARPARLRHAVRREAVPRGPRCPSCSASRFSSTWIFDVEILARRIAQGSAGRRPPAQASVSTSTRSPEWTDVGGSKLRPGAYLRAALDLLRIRRRYLRGGRRSSRHRHDREAEGQRHDRGQRIRRGPPRARAASLRARGTA